MMNKLTNKIFRFKTLMTIFLMLLVCVSFVNDVNADTKSPKTTDFCIVSSEQFPDLQKEAQCEKESCATTENCIDPAPVLPVKGVSSVPGPRKKSVDVNGKPVGSTNHKGNDIVSPEGSPIYAGGTGVIDAIGFQMNYEKNSGWGNYIRIKHDDGETQTLYAHMKCFASVKGADGSVTQLGPGSKVHKGQIIGFVGSTGGVSGPHLHYEIIKNNEHYNAFLQENADSGLLCEIPETFKDVESGANGISVGCESSSGCTQVYNDDTVTGLSHKYESGGDYCINNKCASGDHGSCSYGSIQFACGPGVVKNYLGFLQKKHPQLYQELGGGSLNVMVQKACTPPATEFKKAFSKMCSSASAEEFKKAQDQFAIDNYLGTDDQKLCLKKANIDFDKLSPTVRASLFTLGVQGAFCKVIRNSKIHGGMSEEEMIKALYAERSKTNIYFKSSSLNIQASVKKRFAREAADALESLKASQAWEEEQKKPEGERRSYEEVVKEATGKEPCARGEMSSFNNCNISGEVSGDGAYGSSSQDKNAYTGKKCAPSNYLATYGSCMFCPVFEVIFNTATIVAKKSFEVLATPVMYVVMIGWAIWLAFMLLSNLSSFKNSDSGEILKNILIGDNKSGANTFLVLIAILLLQSDAAHFFSWALEPIFNTGFTLAQLVVDGKECSPEYNLIKDGSLPISMGNSILCTVEAIQRKLQSTMALGVSSMCIGLFVKSQYFIFPGIPYLFAGLAMFAGALVMIIIFPFLMIDSIFSLSVACALLPAAIGAYPFKITKHYATHVWSSFMNAMFNFIFLSIIILVLTEAIDTSLFESIYQTMGISENASEEEKISIMDERYMEVVLNELAWGTVALVKVCFVLILGWACMGEANKFAQQFAENSFSKDIGSQIGGMAAQGTKKIGARAWEDTKTAAKALKSEAKGRYNDWSQQRKIDKVMNNKNKEAIVENGVVVGYKVNSKSSIRGRNKSTTVLFSENGTPKVTTTKNYGKGKVVTTESDGYIKRTTRTDSDGNVVGQNMEIESGMLKAVRNYDGSMNMVALDNALSGSAYKAEEVKAAVMLEYAKKSFPSMADKLSKMDIRNIKMDKRGNVSIINRDKDGNKSVLKMSVNKNGRALVEYSHTDVKGNKSSMATDGMFNRKQSSKVVKGADGLDVETDVKSVFGLSKYYAERSKYGIMSNGEWHNMYAKHGGTAFSEEEIQIMHQQFKRNRAEGRTSVIKDIL